MLNSPSKGVHVQPLFSGAEGHLFIAGLACLSLLMLLMNAHAHHKARSEQRKLRSWLLQRVHRDEFSHQDLEAKLPKSRCPHCRAILSHELRWLQKTKYLSLDTQKNFYALTKLGMLRLRSKRRNPNFAKPGWVRLVGHLHIT